MLLKLNIKYDHIIDLAPPKEIREFQKRVDLQNDELKSERGVLGQVFVTEYENRVLNNFDFDLFIEKLKNTGASKIVLFCVEKKSSACHRSMVSKKLHDRYSYKVIHL